MNAEHLGIEIGGTKLQLVRGDSSGSIQTRRRFPVDPSAGADGIRGQLESSLPEFLREPGLRGIGVGFGGPVDWEAGEVARSHQISGWSGFPLAQWLREQSGLRVWVENDANVAGLGEAMAGSGKGCNPVFYVTLGSGVGGGLVVDRRIYHGAKPGESEIGHVRLNRDGERLESHCSGWAMDAKVRELIRAAPKAPLALLADGTQGGEARLLVKAIEAGDREAERLLRETAGDLAFGLSHVMQLMHPEVIVLGGGLSLLGERFRLAVEQAMRPWVMEVFLPGLNVRLSGLREDAVPVGALLLAAQQE